MKMQLISLTFVGCILSLNILVSGRVNPITIQGKNFVDSITRDPFFIKGVDYQPGGSSAVNSEHDPLSNSETCARDIILFQELGINTIRVYSVNPDLNHDECMTMLASAGIYLILDVNSPLQNQHLNRYEPWTTYNEEYLTHVFKVVEQFGYYNNTLGFFAGNEVVNDGLSARRSPVYVRSVINDMKQYIQRHSPRRIPVGYSAADDLRYRVPLSYYLGCQDDDNPESSVDFYGVNSYQWCGEQTFESSGYDKLVNAYKHYSKPVFFSEFGCNNVLPRTFTEIDTLYSKDMIHVFSGGLVYEFTEEPNNYGLVKIGAEGEVHLLEDFQTLKMRYSKLCTDSFQNLVKQMKQKPSFEKRGLACQSKYENLQIDSKIANNLGANLIENGVKAEKGKYVDLSENSLKSMHKVYNVQGGIHDSVQKIKIVQSVNSLTTTSNNRPLEHTDRSHDKPNGAARAFKRSLLIKLCVLAYSVLEFAFQVAVYSV